MNAAGNAYVVGATCSTDFPTVNPLQPDNAGGDLGEDVFMAKVDTTGSALLYSTYLGGSDEDGAVAVAVDRSDNAYVAGFTNSCDFPTANALQPAIGDCVLGSDGFIAKFDPGGNRLIYSTYLGGTAGDGVDAIAVDASGSVYVAGGTNSTDFPTVNAIQAANADSGELNDVFVAQIDAGGKALVYSTYLGGEGIDERSAIAVDSSGNAYVAGSTNSTDFPTVNPAQDSNAGFHDAFITKVAPDSEGGQHEGGEGGGTFGWYLLTGLSMMAGLRAALTDRPA